MNHSSSLESLSNLLTQSNLTTHPRKFFEIHKIIINELKLATGNQNILYKLLII